MTLLYQIILYCADQQRSSDFYKKVLNIDPALDVPGMTEFNLNASLKLGLMPEKGIAKIIGSKLPHPSTGNGIPRCEIYIHTDELQGIFSRAQSAGGQLIDSIKERDWGDTVGYVCDPDGHILAFAERTIMTGD